jgi:lysyl-tRNA synthetase class 2
MAGAINLASAITTPLDRLHVLADLVPLAVPPAATQVVALSGLALLGLSRGIRRGQRRAWLIALGLLVASLVGHVVNGGGLEETMVAAAAVTYLWAHRSSFAAPSDRSSTVFGLGAVAAATLASVAVAVAAVELDTDSPPRPPFGRAVTAVVERLAGNATIPLPGHPYMGHVLLAVGAGLVATTGWVLTRPLLVRSTALADRARARVIVEQHGRGSLDFFALRDDKRHFFHGSSLVAYAVIGRVCLVAPDPIGPDEERTAVWAAFRAFVDQHGWPLAVMGVAEHWLPIYQGSGMRTMYVGDEAIVDCASFRLDGRRFKGLRQAVNRVRRYGYRVEFHDPAALSPELRAQLQAVLDDGRRGACERGFSMTLGRAFDPDDRGLLLAVCRDPDGVPVAFCQYVPAPGLPGWSLDLMRRSRAPGPNGIIDFIVVETIDHLRERGDRGLALNFATLRAVMADEMGGALGTRAEKWLAQRLSKSMQIESLCYFTAKYDPDWQPRYAAYASPEDFAPSALALARAEGLSELPLVGRLLAP